LERTEPDKRQADGEARTLPLLANGKAIVPPKTSTIVLMRIVGDS
jgi:hypothetical protein